MNAHHSTPRSLLEHVKELEERLSGDEEVLNEVVETLQKERVFLSTGEIPELLKTMAHQAQLLDRLEEGCGPREALCGQIWEAAGQESEMPEAIPEFLYALAMIERAEFHAGLRSDLKAQAQRLEALLEVIEEIYLENQRLRKSSLGWMDQQVKKFISRAPVEAYQISGRPLYLSARVRGGAKVLPFRPGKDARNGDSKE